MYRYQEPGTLASSATGRLHGCIAGGSRKQQRLDANCAVQPRRARLTGCRTKVRAAQSRTTLDIEPRPISRCSGVYRAKSASRVLPLDGLRIHAARDHPAVGTRGLEATGRVRPGRCTGRYIHLAEHLNYWQHYSPAGTDACTFDEHTKASRASLRGAMSRPSCLGRATVSGSAHSA